MSDTTTQQIDYELESLKKSFKDLKADKEQLEADKEQLEAEKEQLVKDKNLWIDTMACLTHVLDESVSCNWKNTENGTLGHWDGYIKKAIELTATKEGKYNFVDGLKDSLEQEKGEIITNPPSNKAERVRILQELITSINNQQKDIIAKASNSTVQQNVNDIEISIEQDKPGNYWNPAYKGYQPNQPNKEISKSLLKF